MKNWGRKKAKPSSSPSHNSSISQVFPMSWISKFKQKASKESEPNPVKEKQKANVKMLCNWKGGRFYGRDDESYWRLSFGDERVDGEKKSRGVLRAIRHNSDDDALEFASSSCQNCRGGEGIWKFSSDMVSDVRKIRELAEIAGVEKEEKWKEFEEPRRKSLRGGKLRKKRGKGYERKPDEAEEMRKFLKEDVKTNDEKDCGLEESEEETSSERRESKEIKVQGVLLKNDDKQRKSFYASCRKGGRVRSYNSPRTVARMECKIKVIEDIKRGKQKTKKMKRKAEAGGRRKTGFDSFAVVKSSVDPQWDFGCSMIEMITENGIRRSEDLEELLACYLTLNADEYHDVIIKVFRQVWFELNQESFSPESQKT